MTSRTQGFVTEVEVGKSTSNNVTIAKMAFKESVIDFGMLPLGRGAFFTVFTALSRKTLNILSRLPI